MAKNFNLYAILGFKGEDFERGLNRARTQLSNFSNNVKGTTSGISGAFKNLGGLGSMLKFAGVAGGLAIIGNEFKKSIQYSIQFEKTLSNLKALTGASSADMKYYKEAASTLGNQFGKTGAEMAETFKIVGSGKSELLKNKEGLVAVSSAAITLSKAAGMEVPEAADALVVAMNQFNAPATEANRYINALAAGAKEGAAEIPNLSASLTKFGSVANALKIPVEQSIAMIEALSEKGLKDEVAGTGIKTFLLRLEQGAKDTRPSVVGLEQALENLKRKNLSVNQAQEMFGMEAANVALALIAQADRVNQLATAVTGTSEAFIQAGINGENVAGSLDKLSAKWTNLRENILNGSGGLSTFLKSFIDGLSQVVELIDRANSKRSSVETKKGKDELEYTREIVSNPSTTTGDINDKVKEFKQRNKWANNKIKELSKNNGYINNSEQIGIAKQQIYDNNKSLAVLYDWQKKNTAAAKELKGVLKPVIGNVLDTNQILKPVPNFSVAPIDVKNKKDNSNNSDTSTSKKKTPLQDYNEEKKYTKNLYAEKLVSEEEYNDLRLKNLDTYLKELTKAGKSDDKAYGEWSNLNAEEQINKDGSEFEVPLSGVKDSDILEGSNAEVESYFDTLQKGLDSINSEPIKYLKSDLQETQDGLAALSESFGMLGGAINGNAGNWISWGADAMGTISQLIPQVAALLGIQLAQGTAAQAKLPFPYNLAAMAATAAGAISIISSIPKFADGGIVPGTSFSGDKVPALVNSGEMILNKGQQANLFSMINNGSSSTGTNDSQLVARVSGRDLEFVLQKNSKFNNSIR
jgi:TP901 family phage tail tape measure protein